MNKTFELDHTQRPSADELLTYPFITEEYVEGSETTLKDKDAVASNSIADNSLTAVNTSLSTPGKEGGKLKGKASNVEKKKAKEKEVAPPTLPTSSGVQTVSTSDYEQSTTNSSLSNVGLL